MEKIRFSISIDIDLVEWLDDQVNKRKFANRSQGIRACIYEQMVKEKNKSSQ